MQGCGAVRNARCTAIYCGAHQQQGMHRAVTHASLPYFFRAIFTLILKMGVFLLYVVRLKLTEKWEKY